MFGRKSEQFISSDPAQLKLDFEGVEQLKEAREYAAVQATVCTLSKEPAARLAKPAKAGQHRIFSEHLERRDEIIEPVEIPAGGKRIGAEVPGLLEYKPGSCIFVDLFTPYTPCRTAKEPLSENCRRCRCTVRSGTSLAQGCNSKPRPSRIGCKELWSRSNRYTGNCGKGCWDAIIFRSTRASFRFWTRISRKLRARVITGWYAHRS